jgi:hypothetical protein
MHAAFDLSGTGFGIDGTPYVVRRNHALDTAVFTENYYLGGVAEGQVGGRVVDRFRRARLSGEVEM